MVSKEYAAMDPREELFVNVYPFSDDKYIETVRERHYWDSDVWLCDHFSRQKEYITTVNTTKDLNWMESVRDIITGRYA